jgi:hypothetical protein
MLEKHVLPFTCGHLNMVTYDREIILNSGGELAATNNDNNYYTFPVRRPGVQKIKQKLAKVGKIGCKRPTKMVLPGAMHFVILWHM